jgi:hypothetical protein
MTAEITVKRSRYRAVQGAVYGETRLPPYEKPLTVHPLFAHYSPTINKLARNR